MRKISRREFGKVVAAKSVLVSLPLAMGGVVSSCTPIWKGVGPVVNWGASKSKVPTNRTPMEPVKNNINSQLAFISSKKVVSGNGNIDPSIMRTMLREGIKSLGGTSKVEDGWSKVFPSYKKGETIGIKVNVAHDTRTRGELISALVDELTDIGIQPGNIIVWDNIRYASLSWEKMGYGRLLKDRTVMLRTTLDPEVGYDKEQFVKMLCRYSAPFKPNFDDSMRLPNKCTCNKKP